jgi:hypothetical protein
VSARCTLGSTIFGEFFTPGPEFLSLCLSLKAL